MPQSFKAAFLLAVSAFFLVGCETIDKARRVDDLEYEVIRLRKQIDSLERERDSQLTRVNLEKKQELRRLSKAKNQEISNLDKARRDLEKKLKKEIGEYRAKLQMTERGLVITFLAEILFDSGKDKIRPGGQDALLKMAEVLRLDTPNDFIAIEGHSDNMPIRHSGWVSNWELSTARALAVLHFMIDHGDMKPARLSAVGYGEYRPVAPNATDSGRQQNRRVEIIILPTEVKKVKAEFKSN